MLKRIAHKFGRMYIETICRREATDERFTRYNERPIEYSFVLRQIALRAPKTVLDIGTGTTAFPKLVSMCGLGVRAIDNVKDYWPKGMFNRHFHVEDIDILAPRLDELFDFITCISTLEHIPDFDRAVSNMLSLTKIGGFLAITSPYNEQIYVENAYQLPDSYYGKEAPYVCQVFSRAQIDHWCNEFGARLVEQELWRNWTGKFWTQGSQIIPPELSARNKPHHLGCMLFQRIEQ